VSIKSLKDFKFQTFLPRPAEIPNRLEMGPFLKMGPVGEVLMAVASAAIPVIVNHWLIMIDHK